MAGSIYANRYANKFCWQCLSKRYADLIIPNGGHNEKAINLLTSDLEVFEQSLIWKRLYNHYTPHILLQTTLDGHSITVRGRKAK